MLCLHALTQAVLLPVPHELTVKGENCWHRYCPLVGITHAIIMLRQTWESGSDLVRNALQVVSYSSMNAVSHKDGPSRNTAIIDRDVEWLLLSKLGRVLMPLAYSALSRCA